MRRLIPMVILLAACGEGGPLSGGEASVGFRTYELPVQMAARAQVGVHFARSAEQRDAILVPGVEDFEWPELDFGLEALAVVVFDPNDARVGGYAPGSIGSVTRRKARLYFGDCRTLASGETTHLAQLPQFDVVALPARFGSSGAEVGPCVVSDGSE